MIEFLSVAVTKLHVDLALLDEKVMMDFTIKEAAVSNQLSAVSLGGRPRRGFNLDPGFRPGMTTTQPLSRLGG
jgi:hypothetical protein